MKDLGENYHIQIRGDLKGFTTSTLVGNERMRVIKKEIQDKAARYFKPILRGYKSGSKIFKTYVKTILSNHKEAKKKSGNKKHKKQEKKKHKKSAKKKEEKKVSTSNIIEKYRKKVIESQKEKEGGAKKPAKKEVTKKSIEFKKSNQYGAVDSTTENLFKLVSEFIKFFGNKKDIDAINKLSKKVLEE
jgi:hypothetical protein